MKNNVLPKLHDLSCVYSIQFENYICYYFILKIYTYIVSISKHVNFRIFLLLIQVIVKIFWKLVILWSDNTTSNSNWMKHNVLVLRNFWNQINSSQPKDGNCPKKSNAIAIEIFTQKSNAIVIMHYFCEKSQNNYYKFFKKILNFSKHRFANYLFILSGKWFHDFLCWLNWDFFSLYQALNGLLISDVYS